VLDCLPMALAELGRFDEAARVQGKSWLSWNARIEKILHGWSRKNLRLYESGQACRQPWREDDPSFAASR